MPKPMKKGNKFRSLKIKDETYYFLRRIAAEERSQVYQIAEKIIREYYENYKCNHITEA